MNLDDAQQRQVAAWIEQGLKLSDIQSRLAADFGVQMTYMEVRFLIDDLKLRPKDPEPPKAPPTVGPSPAVPPGKPGAPSPPPAAPFAEPEHAGAPGRGVSLTVDQLARPGAMVSGKVTFSDGKSAEWYLDQMGRLGLAPREKGYRPSQSDVLTFQDQLQSELAKLGF